MANCSICLEGFTSPVSLPCGHVFCLKCIRRTVDSVKSRPMTHFCPTCRAGYSLLSVDPKLVPVYLRPHILPPIRRVFIDDASPSPSTASSSSSNASNNSTLASASAPAPPVPAPTHPEPNPSPELARALAELNALRQHCATWRQRAESHAMGNNALLGLARAAKDCALRMRAERDAERSRCVLLKRKLAELGPESELEEECAPTSKSRAGGVVPPPPTGLPVYLMQMQCKPVERFYDNPADVEASHFGPPMKRRRTAAFDAASLKAGSDAGVDPSSILPLNLKASAASLKAGSDTNAASLKAAGTGAAAPDPACDSILVKRMARSGLEALPLVPAGTAQ